tara:strand:- start:755 stop:1129 length:375 start_codon:yes stop_codon:yes gene_type:complete
MIKKYSVIESELVGKKQYWDTSFLEALLLTENDYSIVDIEKHLIKNYAIFNSKSPQPELKFSISVSKLLKIPFPSKLRLSQCMNHFISKFLIENEKPNTFYYSNNEEPNKLSDFEINNIFKSII